MTVRVAGWLSSTTSSLSSLTWHWYSPLSDNSEERKNREPSGRVRSLWSEFLVSSGEPSLNQEIFTWLLESSLQGSDTGEPSVTWLDWGDSTMREAEDSDVKIVSETGTESATNILPSALLCVPLTTELTTETQSASQQPV